MDWIIIFRRKKDDDPGWFLLIMILFIFMIGAVVVWPVVMHTYNSSSSGEEKMQMIMWMGFMVLTCICVTIIYTRTKSFKWRIFRFFRTFGIICCMTTLGTGTLYSLIIAFQEMITGGEVLACYFMSLLLSVIPSFVATCICAVKAKKN